MKTELTRNYLRFRKENPFCHADHALRMAKTITEWQEAESAGLVRLKADEERESYFSVYGEPDSEQERKAIVHSLELYGCFVVYSEVNTGSEASGDNWEMCDSVGMCVYKNPLDPFENYYVPDLMQAALRQIPQPGNVDELCSSL